METPTSTLSGAPRTLPTSLAESTRTSSPQASAITASGDSIVFATSVQPICGRDTANAVLVRGVVVATIVQSSVLGLPCAFLPGYPFVRLAVHRVPPGLHLVDIALVQQTLDQQNQLVGKATTTVVVRQYVRLE